MFNKIDRKDMQQAGFTLVELVVVIVIVAIIGAIAMPRFFDDRTFAERGFYEELVASLKYAQKAAVASGCPVRVEIDASGYRASQQVQADGRCDPADSSFATPIVLSDGQQLAATVPTGVVLAPALVFQFNALGATDLGGNQTISVGPYALSVQAASGFVDTP